MILSPDVAMTDNFGHDFLIHAFGKIQFGLPDQRRLAVCPAVSGSTFLICVIDIIIIGTIGLDKYAHLFGQQPVRYLPLNDHGIARWCGSGDGIDIGPLFFWLFLLKKGC